jgi:hypothetical protein
LDGELEKIAGPAYELTAPAREALRAELAKRGLRVELAEPPVVVPGQPLKPMPGPPSPEPLLVEAISDGEFELRPLATIARFRDLPEALLAKGSLKSAGIDSFRADDNVVRLDWFWSNLMGRIKVRVDVENAEAAEEILDQPIPESLEVTGIGEYRQPRCPKCGSLDVNFQEFEPVSYVLAYFSLPIPLQRPAWRCRSCYVQWEDERNPDTGQPDSPG